MPTASGLLPAVLAFAMALTGLPGLSAGLEPVPEKMGESRQGAVSTDASSECAWYDESEKLFKRWTIDGSKRSVVYSTSQNGNSWERQGTVAFALPGNPGSAAPVIEGIDVVKVKTRSKRQYLLYYAAGDVSGSFAIGLASSADGRCFQILPAWESPFNTPGVILKAREQRPGKTGGATTSNIRPIVERSGKLFHMWYSQLIYDSDGEPVAARVAAATSNDGIAWTVRPDYLLSLNRDACRRVSDRQLKASLYKFAVACKETCSL